MPNVQPVRHRPARDAAFNTPAHADEPLPQQSGAYPEAARQRNVFWIVIATLPFAMIYAAHFCSWNGSPTGFIQLDMPYYAANGREIFERGNGFAYPNPYDPDATAPVIYFHWLVWCIGFGITQVGLDPGFQFVALGAAAGLLMSALTWSLVRHVLGRDEYCVPLFLLTMWGGGLLCAGKLVYNLLTGTPASESLLAFDPGNGLWFLNWGRNLTFPTEATYHRLSAGCWLCCWRPRTRGTGDSDNPRRIPWLATGL